MPKPLSEFTSYCVDALSPLGEITIRAMFGGYGLYNYGTIFAIIISDTLYFKANETTIPFFEEHGCSPFTYEKNGKKYAMKYYAVPGDLLENREKLEEFFEVASSVARKK